MKELFEKIKQNFEFFEKKQGRPSKETLRKRRIFYITLVSLFVLVLVGITSLTLSKINKNKLKGETTSATTNNFIFAEGAYDNDENDYNYYVTRPTNVKYYKMCFYQKNTAGNYEQYGCTNENSDINKFLLSPFSKENKKEQYKISIQVFEDSNYTIVNKNVNTWKPNGWKTNSIDNSAYAEFTINPSTHETCINDEVEDGKVNSNIVGSYLSVFKRIINFLYRIFGQEPPYKVNTDTEQLGIVKKAPDIEETSGVSNVTAEKTYNTAFELKNTYNSKAYYKIVKYKSINLKPENLTDKGTCLAFNGKSVNVKTSFNISRTNKEAAGVLKVFLSKELCEAEDGDYTKAFTQSITKYKYTGSTATTKTTTTTKKPDIEPKMKLSSITAYGKNLGTSTVKKTVSGKEYNVHEIKNSGQVNLVYNATTGVKNADSYYRRLNLYKSFDGKTVSYSSTCRKYNEFDGEAKDDFVMNSDNKTVRTEFVIYSDANCTKEVNNKKTTDYFLYTGDTSSTTTTTKNNDSKISISFKDTDGSEKDSSGAYVVSSSGSYTPIVTIKNPNAQKIYYRWFTYRGLNASTFNWASSCENTSEKEYTKKDLENLWVDTSGEYSQRSGKLKVYSDYNSCDKDGTGTNSSNVLALSIVNYKYNDPSTNTTGFKFLRNYTNGNATLANITKKIGSQTPSDCYDYALAYGVYIIKNGSGSFDNLKCNSYYHPAGDYGGSAYGANGSGQYTNSVTGYRNMYDKIKSTIDSSLPIVIRIDNSRAGGSGTHFITIIGYKDTVKSASINSWSDFKRALWVLDPAYLEGGQVMSKPLSSFAYNFYSDEPSQLFWWNKASDAKMPKWCGN